MTSDIFCPFFTYLPCPMIFTLLYHPIFGGSFGPPTDLKLDVIYGCSLNCISRGLPVGQQHLIIINYNFKLSLHCASVAPAHRSPIFSQFQFDPFWSDLTWFNPVWTNVIQLNICSTFDPTCLNQANYWYFS